MSEFVIYHNPRCSKSRQTLALLHENGIEPKVIEYLKTPPTVSELKDLLSKINMNASQLIRSKEQDYRDLALQQESDTKLLEAMHNHPKLIERPIVVKNDKAIIGRPPELVEFLL